MKSSTFGTGLRYSRLESTARVPNIKQIVWNETRAIKFKTARIRFSSDIFPVNEFDELFLSLCTTWSMMPDKNNVLVSALIIILIKMGVSKFCKWVQRSFLFLVDNFSNKEKKNRCRWSFWNSHSIYIWLRPKTKSQERHLATWYWKIDPFGL